MHSNNDLMDPKWKPEPAQEVNALRECMRIIELLNKYTMKVTEDQLQSDDYVLTIKFSMNECKEIQKLYKQLTYSPL